MDDKKITEQESLELITQMINQTKMDSAIGSGDTFLIWGYPCVVCFLAVAVLTYFVGGNNWGWLYLAIPAFGLSGSFLNTKRRKKRHNSPTTYSASNINSIWRCLTFVFVAYIIKRIFDWELSEAGMGMYLLVILLSGIGTYATGTILKEECIQAFGMFGIFTGLDFLYEVCCNGKSISFKWQIFMVISLVFTFVLPGHYLNYKSKKLNNART